MPLVPQDHEYLSYLRHYVIRGLKTNYTFQHQGKIRRKLYIGFHVGLAEQCPAKHFKLKGLAKK